MRKVIIDSKNQNKILAAKKAVEKTIHFDYEVTGINLGIEDVKPLSKEELDYALGNRQEKLLRSLPTTWDMAIILQKGIIPNHTTKEVFLTFSTQLLVNKGEDTDPVQSTEPVLLEERIYSLIFIEHKDVYESYKEVYGDLGKISLYEKVTGKDESDWMSRGIEKNIIDSQTPKAIVAY